MTELKSKIRERELIRVEEDALINFQFAVIDRLKEQGLSQNDLASMLGVSKARVSQLLSSVANPTVKLVARVCDVLDLNISYESKGEKTKTQTEFVSNNMHHKSFERITPDWLSAAKFMSISSTTWGCNDNNAEVRKPLVKESA